MVFWTYMLHCRGGVFYTGHTDDLDRRIAEHQSEQVPGFTQDRHPIELVWSQEFPTRYEALEAERRIKGWSRAKQLALIRGDWDGIVRLSNKKGGPSTSSGRTAVRVKQSVIDAMAAEAARVHPHECCGILLGEGAGIEQALPTANVHPHPATQFEIDPQALIDAHRAARSGGPQVVGYYHSHPTGPAAPSPVDQEQASGDGRIWAIVGAGDVTFWRDDEGGFANLPYITDEG